MITFLYILLNMLTILAQIWKDSY